MPDTKLMTAAQAIREAIDDAMRTRPEVFLMGEGVADPGGIFGTTKGLIEAYGADRVIEMPVAENGLTGIAVGAALMGRRPIMTHQRVDFALLCIEQLVNTAAKSHYVTNGHHKVPLTVRMVIGRGWGQGPQHSQVLDAMFAYFPGLKVVMPATPADFKGLLTASIEDDNPVIFLEHRWLHYVSGQVPTGHHSVPLDGPHLARTGRDVTIVASGYMSLEATRAATCLAKVGVEAELFDLRVLRPMKLDAIAKSVARTGRLIVCDNGWKTLGIGAEVVASLAEAGVPFQRPPVRIGLPDHPTPSSLVLAETFYPDSADIIRAVARLHDMPEADVHRAIEDVKTARAGVPIDKPDPSFKGPF